MLTYSSLEINYFIPNDNRSLSVDKCGWLFPNQYFGLYLRWPFSNYVSTCSWDVCQACEDDDDQIEVFFHTEVCDPEGLTTVLIGSIKSNIVESVSVWVQGGLQNICVRITL